MACGWMEADARAHVLAKACAPLDDTYTNDKNVARHRALARNQDWMALRDHLATPIHKKTFFL